jgi:hypothetical protein
MGRKEGRREVGCSLDGDLSGCNLPSLLQSQPGCTVNAPHSTNPQNKRNPIYALSEVPTSRKTIKKKKIPLLKDPTCFGGPPLSEIT